VVCIEAQITGSAGKEDVEKDEFVLYAGLGGSRYRYVRSLQGHDFDFTKQKKERRFAYSAV
jgi:hypothetical protein